MRPALPSAANSGMVWQEVEVFSFLKAALTSCHACHGSGIPNHGVDMFFIPNTQYTLYLIPTNFYILLVPNAPLI